MLTNARSKQIASLATKKYRIQLGQTLVEGLRAFEGAVSAGAPLVEVVVTHEAGAREEVAALLAKVPVPVHHVDERTIARLSDVEASQGILAVVETTFVAPEDLGRCERILALDAVQDPGNIGTLIRTACWFGLGGVLIGAGTADPFSPKVVRATMSALWEVKLATTPDLPETLQRLAADGFAVHAAAVSGIDAREWNPTGQAILALGNEANGLSPEVLEMADTAVSVRGSEGRRGVDSLNVATAGAVLMYQWTR